MKNIGGCMKHNVISVRVTATIAEAAATLVAEHIGTLPVVDRERRLVGIVHIHDLLELVMPTFVDLVDDFDYVLGDFSIFESQVPRPEVEKQPVTTVMDPPLAVKPISGLLRAFAIMDSHHLYDLPVVDDDNRLVGIASRVDIGTALLAAWPDTVTTEAA